MTIYIRSRSTQRVARSTQLSLLMLGKDDLQARWWKLEEKLMERFEKKPDVEAILFMIGIQELGDIQKKFTKEQKQDLIHIAVCTVLTPSGYFELSHVDEDGWPHFKMQQPLTHMPLGEQDLLLRRAVITYFEKKGIV